MSNSFNLKTFLGEYKGYNERSYTGAEVREMAMENRDIANAQAAVNNQVTFLGATLKGKIGEYYGPRVQQQLVDTAVNAVAGIVAPVNDYLEKYFDMSPEEMNRIIQTDAFQMWSTKHALEAEAEKTSGVGKISFIMDM